MAVGESAVADRLVRVGSWDIVYTVKLTNMAMIRKGRQLSNVFIAKYSMLCSGLTKF